MLLMHRKAWDRKGKKPEVSPFHRLYEEKEGVDNEVMNLEMYIEAS